MKDIAIDSLYSSGVPNGDLKAHLKRANEDMVSQTAIHANK